MILDVPCGGGVAFRGLRPGQRVRYVAADLSPVMLGRARAEAKRRDLHQIEFTEADVEALPFKDASFNLMTSASAAPDCTASPTRRRRSRRSRASCARAACCEAPRSSGGGLRQDAFVRLYQVAGVFGPSGTPDELASWLADTGMFDVSTRNDGALTYFSAQRNPEQT